MQRILATADRQNAVLDYHFRHLPSFTDVAFVTKEIGVGQEGEVSARRSMLNYYANS